MNQQQAITLVEYNAWANHRLLLKAARLPVTGLFIAAGLSHQSVMGTLVHILDTQWYWREGAQFGLLPMDSLSAAEFSSVQSLRRRWDEEDQALLTFVRGLSDSMLNGNVEYRWKGARPRSRPLWHILQHITNHGTHHRSEIGSYLAAQGLSPKDLDFIKYVARANDQ